MTDLRERLRLDTRDGDSPIAKGAVFDGARASLEFSIVENMEAFQDAVNMEEWPSSISHLQSAAVAALKLASWIISQAPDASTIVEPKTESSVRHTMQDTLEFLRVLRGCIGGTVADEEVKAAPHSSRDPEAE